MNNRIIIVVSALIILAIGFLLSSNGGSDDLSQDIPVSDKQIYQDRGESGNMRAEDTVSSFMENFIASAPSEGDMETLDAAVSLLSEGAKLGMGEDPTSGDLASMLGVQDFPDEGYQIGEVTYLENEATGEENALAEVEVSLNYSGGDTERIFLLSKSDSGWQIDGVRLPEDQEL